MMMARQLSPDSKLSQALRQFADAVVVNVLFVLCSLPVVTIGASFAAAHVVMLDAVREQGSKPGRSFVRAFAATWRPATLAWLICAGVGTVLAWEYSVLGAWDASVGVLVAQALVITGLICIGIWVVWVFPLIAHGHRFREASTRALWLGIGFLPRSVLGLVIYALPGLGVVLFPEPWQLLVPLMAVVGFALQIFLIDVVVARALPPVTQ